MRPRLLKKGKILTVRLSAIVAATFLPLNLLMIFVSGMTAARELEAAYQSDVGSSMGYAENALLQLEGRMDSFVLANVNTLTHEGSQDVMVDYSLLERLSDVFNAASRQGVYYLYNKETGRLYLKNTPEAFSYGKIQAVKESLAQTLGGTARNQWGGGKPDSGQSGQGSALPAYAQSPREWAFRGRRALRKSPTPDALLL